MIKIVSCALLLVFFSTNGYASNCPAHQVLGANGVCQDRPDNTYVDIPEPETLVLLGAGAVVIAALRKRKSKEQHQN